MTEVEAVLLPPGMAEVLNGSRWNYGDGRRGTKPRADGGGSTRGSYMQQRVVPCWAAVRRLVDEVGQQA